MFWQILQIVDCVGYLIVDESFVDLCFDLLVVGECLVNVIVLCSFGKFWGLVGLWLGFVIVVFDLVVWLVECVGLWFVSGLVIQIGMQVLVDDVWFDVSVIWLVEVVLYLDQIVMLYWFLVGGMYLFWLYYMLDV